MIPVTPQPEPATFDARCRKRGQAWIASHPGYDRPNDYWTEFELDLRTAFDHKCGWCAMLIMRGQVDHFVPVAEAKRTGNDNLCYEWTNFRYVEGWLNQKKLSAEVLDPFVVQAGWFEIQLPSMQLLATKAIPGYLVDLAEFTLKRLGLKDGEVILRFREEWFDQYRKRNVNLDGLRHYAPQIAEAIERDLALGVDWRY